MSLAAPCLIAHADLWPMGEAQLVKSAKQICYQWSVIQTSKAAINAALSMQVTPRKHNISCRLQSTKLMSLLISKNISKRKPEFGVVLCTSNFSTPWWGCYVLLTTLSAVLNSIFWHDIWADIPLFNQELNVPFKFLFKWGWIRRWGCISLEKNVPP